MQKKYVLALDVERNDSNSLTYPKVFNAIAVKVYDTEMETIVDEFGLRLPQEFFSGQFSTQVLWNVLKNMPEVNTVQELYSSFWAFWEKWRDRGARPWACSAKLECVFIEHVMDMLNKPFAEGPWGIDDVRVLMYALNYPADDIRSIEFAGLEGKVNRHHPGDDCSIVIECYKRCAKELGL